MTDSVLAELALRLAPSAEDVATEGLAYLLARSPAARSALQRLFGEWCGGALPTISAYRTQAAGPDQARPDIAALGADGEMVAILENKFWAALTPAQPGVYLERLGAGGLLCFVVPSVRLSILWPEILERARAAGYPVSLTCENQEARAARADSVSLAIVSWPYLLRKLRGALDANGETGLLGDLQQIEGLAARMDASGFLPLSAADLTGDHARRTLDYCRVVDGITEALLRLPIASRGRLRSSAGRGWYGQYLWLHGLGAQVAYEAERWRDLGRTPIWLRISSESWQFSPEIERLLLLRFPAEEIQRSTDPFWRGCWMPIRLREGQEMDAVVAHATAQVVAFVDALQPYTTELARRTADAEPLAEPT